MSRCAWVGSRRWMLPVRGFGVAGARCARRCRRRAQKWSPRPSSSDRRALARRLPAASSVPISPSIIVVVDRVALLLGAVEASSRQQRGAGLTSLHLGADRSTPRSRTRCGVPAHRRLNSAAIASSAPCRSVAPPGGSGSRTGPCSRLGSRIVACPGVVASPRWLVADSSTSTAGRSPSARYLRVDAPAQPLRVADVVEPAELAVELPQPGVVAHPVGAEVDEPRLAHAAVVERGRVAALPREFAGPSARAASRRGRSGRRGGRSAGCGCGSGSRGAAA